jgi:hypothetical protein
MLAKASDFLIEHFLIFFFVHFVLKQNEPKIQNDLLGNYSSRFLLLDKEFVNAKHLLKHHSLPEFRA